MTPPETDPFHNAARSLAAIWDVTEAEASAIALRMDANADRLPPKVTIRATFAEHVAYLDSILGVDA